MKKLVVLTLTVLVLGITNWIISILFNLNLIDISIPLAIVFIVITYLMTSNGGTLSKQMDMQIQGETGIKVATSKVNKKNISFIFLGSLFYFLFTLAATFYTYRDYFV